MERGWLLMAIDKVVDSGLLDAGLTSIADKIRSRSNGTSQLVFPEGFVSEIDNIPSGTSSYKLLSSKDLYVSTTDTSPSSAGSIDCDPSDLNWNKILYIRVRDIEGKRVGYFYGTDTFFFLNYEQMPSSTIYQYGLTGCYSTEGAAMAYTNSASTTGHGVWAYQVVGRGRINIYKRFNSTITQTIKSTYRCELFALDWPDNISPFIPFS